MARTGSPVARSVLHALGLSSILMERLFFLLFLLLLLSIHLGVFVACDSVQLPTLGVGNQETELRLLRRNSRNDSANRK
jgi:hypothetical protein